MNPSVSRVAHRFQDRIASVKVEVIPKATEKARAQFGQGIAIGRFKSPIPLFRVFDGEELRRILDTGEIKGGDYSVPGERAFGAQWAGDKNEIAKWGERQRGKRLGHELFMAEINGNGRVFAHLTGADGQMTPEAGTVSLDPSFCYGGLGCSVQVGLNDVSKWYVVEGGTPKAIPLAELRDMASQAGLKPRDIDLHLGVLLTPPLKAAKALRYEIQGQIDISMDRWERDRSWRSLGIGPRDHMDSAKLGPLLLRQMCKVTDCESEWTPALSKALAEANPSGSDPSRGKFAIHASITVNTAIPHLSAEMLPGTEGTVKYLDVYVPEKRFWARIWQPWGAAKITFLEGGGIAIR